MKQFLKELEYSLGKRYWFMVALADLTPIHLKAASFHVVFLIIPIAANLIDLRTGFGASLQMVSYWIEQGKVKIHVDAREFSFDDIVDAHEYFESGKSKGKVVISK